jgi:tetratricopeptide (TPR) repeat protein
VTSGADAAEARARALLNLGRPAQAEAVITEALVREPDSASLQVLLSRAFLAQQRFRDARAQAQMALALGPENFEGLSCLAAALSGQHDYEAALEAVRRARSIEPMNPAIHVQAARIYLAADKPVYARSAARHARELAPESADAAVALAQALYQCDEFTEAADMAATALRLGPESPGAHAIAGLVSLRAGLTGRRGSAGKESIQRYREALRLNPTDDHAKQDLAIALKARNPVYRMFLGLEIWLSGLPPGRQWAVRLSPLVIARLTAPFRDQVWSKTVLVVAVVFVAASWGTDPISNLLLMTSRPDRGLLPPAAVRSARAFLAFALAAAACFVTEWITGTRMLIPLGFGLALWSFAAGSMHTIAPRRRKLAGRVLLASAICAMAGAITVALNIKPAAIAIAAVLLVGGAIMTWYVALADRPTQRR